MMLCPVLWSFRGQRTPEERASCLLVLSITVMTHEVLCAQSRGATTSVPDNLTHCEHDISDVSVRQQVESPR